MKCILCFKLRNTILSSPIAPFLITAPSANHCAPSVIFLATAFNSHPGNGPVRALFIAHVLIFLPYPWLPYGDYTFWFFWSKLHQCSCTGGSSFWGSGDCFELARDLQKLLWELNNSLVIQLVKYPPALRETWEDPLEKRTTTHSNSGLENCMNCIVHGVTKSQTWLNDFHFTSGSRLIRVQSLASPFWECFALNMSSLWTSVNPSVNW